MLHGVIGALGRLKQLQEDHAVAEAPKPQEDRKQTKKGPPKRRRKLRLPKWLRDKLKPKNTTPKPKLPSDLELIAQKQRAVQAVLRGTSFADLSALSQDAKAMEVNAAEIDDSAAQSFMRQGDLSYYHLVGFCVMTWE